MLRIAAGAGVVSLGLMAFPNSIPTADLRSPKVEFGVDLFDMMKNPFTSPNTIDVQALSMSDAGQRRRPHPPGAAGGRNPDLSSFVPDQQKEKLALIADANTLLDATINLFEVAASLPSDADTVAAFKDTAGKLRTAAGNAQDKPRATPAAWPMRWTRW
ncbi:MAG: hypothetical protein U1E93_04275 [Alphaproteobacteria bacterium]